MLWSRAALYCGNIVQLSRPSQIVRLSGTRGYDIDFWVASMSYWLARDGRFRCYWRGIQGSVRTCI